MNNTNIHANNENMHLLLKMIFKLRFAYSELTECKSENEARVS